MFSLGLGRSLKVVHECYRFARERSSEASGGRGSKKSIFSPVIAPQTAADLNSYVKELFWCFNYLTSLGSDMTEQLIVSNEHLLSLFLEDVEKETEFDLSPILLALCTIVDHTCSTSDQEEPPKAQTLAAVFAFVTNPVTYRVLIATALKTKGLAKHCLYLLSNSVALVHSMQDPQATRPLKQTL